MNSVFDQIKYLYSPKYISINDYRITYIDEGDSEKVLLFVHGLGSYIKAWDRNIPELKKHFRCIALDLPGYGKSSKQIHSGKVSFYTKIIDEIIFKLKLKNVSIIGHSMGGQIAASYILDYPDIIKNLILAAPAGFESFTKEEIHLIEKNITPESVFNTTDKQIELNYKYNFFNMPVEAGEMIADRILIKQDVDFFNHCSVVSKSLSGLLNAPVISRLNEIEIPTLILFGKNDLLIPNKSIHKTSTEIIANFGATKIKNSSLVMIDKCGHFLQYEKPELFNSSLISFIK